MTWPTTIKHPHYADGRYGAYHLVAMDQRVVSNRPRVIDATSRVGLTAKDVHLLRAALLDGPAAASAFAAWRQGLDINDIDYGWSRLLPLVQRNLARSGLDDPWLPRMKGIRRLYWVRNLTLLHRVRPVLAALAAAGIPVILLKGAGITASFRDSVDLRPMDDVDIMVPPDRLAQVVDMMATLGWRPKEMPPCSAAEMSALTHTAGWPFVDSDGTELDLHWRALNLDGRIGNDLGFWQRATPARLAGQQALVLAPADQLLHVCVHAVAWAGFSNLRWAADAALIIRVSRDRLDWATLCAEARRRGFAMLMHDCLGFLASDLSLPVPRAVLDDLRREARFTERLEVRINRGNPLTRAMPQRLAAKFVAFRRADPDLPDQPWRRAVMPFLRQVLETRSSVDVPGLLLFHLLRRPAWMRRALRVDRRLRRSGSHRPPGDHGPAVPASLGATLDLMDGAPAACLLGWWSGADARDGGRWTTGPEARILWDVASAPAVDLICELDAEGFVVDQHPRLAVRVFANDRRVATLRFVHGQTPPLHRFTIPCSAVAGGAHLCLCFDIRHPRSPASLGVGADGRLLGLLVRRVKLAPRGGPSGVARGSNDA
jgi:hypothetical protein